MKTGTRRFRRFRVESLNIRAKTLFAAEAELLNISLAGACLKTEQSVKATEKQIVRLGADNQLLTLPCSVIWEDQVPVSPKSTRKSAPAYKAGVAFSPLLPYKVVILKDFIRLSGVPYEQKETVNLKPSLLRFHLHSHSRAVMYYTKTALVKKIGLGGMLAELHCEMPRGKMFLMELFLPDGSPPMRFRARIASSMPTPGRAPGHFDTGIEFLDMTTVDKFRLSKFLLFSKIPAEK